MISTGASRIAAPASFFFAAAGLAQDSTAIPRADTSINRLRPVVVEVARGPHRSPLELPLAITVQIPDSARPGQRHLAVDETLFLIPGLAVANRNNPAQDPRISIRGFGARSAFGVRGIRVLRDGIPLTLPDGQTPVDYLDLESVGRVEVLRGSASSLYGNAAGGVVDIRTSDELRGLLTGSARLWSGSYGSRRLVGKLGGTVPVSGLRYQGNVANIESEGFRHYSRQRTTSGFGRIAVGGGRSAYALTYMGLTTPLAENPGSLTAAQLADDPRLADPLSVRKRARKTVSQSQIGLTAARAGRIDTELAAYGGTRSLDNPLAFGIVDVERTTGGGSARIAIPFTTLSITQRLTLGADAQLQNDLRRNFTNCNDSPPPTLPTPTCPDPGTERGSVTLHQRELVSSLGGYLRDEVKLGRRYLLTMSARADAIRFEVRDRLVTATNPDDSGVRSLGAVSPMVGIVALMNPLHSAYANVSSAFETPTATELGNQPSGAAGINRDLKPQRSLTYELGMKGVANVVQYNTSLFATAVKDELIPFDIPASSGRRYFRNAGRTSRRGAELGVGTLMGPLEVRSSYTFANYRFTDFTVDTARYAGKRIPGVPRQSLQGSVALKTPLLTLVGEGSVTGRVFVNDANSESAPGYGIVNLRAVAGRDFGAAGFDVTAGVQNLFDREYVSSVSVNAAAGKYYEPGSRRAVYVGVTAGGGFR